jgi:eukaryotic-like serine/threonine-protein kinase
MESLPPMSRDLTDTVVAGKYRVVEPVGHGAMGSVWAAKHVSLGHTVAIKFVHPELTTNKDAIRRFETEAKAAAKLKSRHVAQVHDHGVTAAGQPYIVMEFLDGQSLEAAIEERGPLPPGEVIDIICEAATALEVAHAAGVVHRDLKPDNIMLAHDGESKRGYTVKLVDFGIAKMVADEVSNVGTTRAGSVLGTPRYMSPEGLTGSSPVGPRSDLWALGASAFAAMVGQVPFEGETIGDIVLHVCSTPLPVPSECRAGLPEGFDVWFARACQRDPEKRFASAREMSTALRQLDRLAREGTEELQYKIRAVEPSIHDPITLPVPPTSSRVRMMAGVVLGASLAVGGLGMFVWRRTDEANRAILEAAASAQAAVEAENARRLKEAERTLLASQFQDASAAVDAGVDAGTRSRREKRP